MDTSESTDFIQIQEPGQELELPEQQSILRRSYERGMATAEYAVGILAAVSLALVLLKIITNEDFFTTLLKVVLDVLGKVSGMLP